MEGYTMTANHLHATCHGAIFHHAMTLTSSRIHRGESERSTTITSVWRKKLKACTPCSLESVLVCAEYKGIPNASCCLSAMVSHTWHVWMASYLNENLAALWTQVIEQRGSMSYSVVSSIPKYKRKRNRMSSKIKSGGAVQSRIPQWIWVKWLWLALGAKVV